MDISNIFKSKTRKALFKLYFTNPEGEYYLRELERFLGLPVSMIRKELIRLEAEGVFLTRKRGNHAYYSINKSYSLFSELKSIVFKTVGVDGALKQSLSKIKGIELAFIYGSFAKQSENAASDIDLFIMGNIDENKLIREIKKAEGSLKREVNYTLYTTDEFRKKKAKKDSFILDLMEKPKVFLIGDKNVL
ncbi:MAG: nucleotidyltransferase domain-containing protein [Candidatus Omnitrophica bacterium]|nr:nucleotidyltransferase domain-containing protein [Candidatus Omnitrophota bacterium]